MRKWALSRNPAAIFWIVTTFELSPFAMFFPGSS